LGKLSKLRQHGLSDAALSIFVLVNKLLSTRHLDPLCNGFLMQPMGVAHLIQHPLCKLFGRHNFCFAKKMLLRENSTQLSLRKKAVAPLPQRQIG
jgi:hypothetical protein